MKNKLVKMLMVFGLAFSFALSACAGKDDPGTADVDIEEDNEDEDDDDDNGWAEEPPMIYPEEINYLTNKDVLKFVKGTWDLTDQITGEVYGTLKVDKDGNVEYTYLPLDTTVSGTISFRESYDKIMQGICNYDLTLTGLEEAFGCWTDEDTSSGNFRIAQTEGKDYLYFEELGNGGSNIGYEVLRAPSTAEDGLHMNWVLTRENDLYYPVSVVADETFYAFVYERPDDQSLVVQRLDEISFESYSEYTDFKTMGAYFDGRGYDAVCYRYYMNPDLSGVLREQFLNQKYPLEVYEITVTEGGISKISDVKRGQYGVYELYPIDQDVECDGDKFRVNSITYSLSDYGVDGDSITDYEVFGDHLIMTTHLNPHANEYVVFNMRTAWPEKKFTGCNYLHGDHVWDSFYSYMDTVYDYEGYPVATIDGNEICDLKFSGTDNSKLVITYWKDGDDSEYEETIDRPVCYNAPIYAYADFRHDMCAETWSEFLTYAPEDSQMFIMVNPPADESWDYYQPEAPDGVYGLDYVYVVALQDSTFINLGGGEGPILDKGQIHCYSLTVPEAGSSITIYAEVEGSETSTWPVSMISGKDDIRYVFA